MEENIAIEKPKKTVKLELELDTTQKNTSQINLKAGLI